MMPHLLLGGLYVQAMKYWYAWLPGVLAGTGFTLLRLILRAWATGKLKVLWLVTRQRLSSMNNHLRRLVLRSKGYLVTALGGYDPILVNLLLSRAALLSKQVRYGKCEPSLRPILEGQLRTVQDAIVKLDPTYADKFRCKPGVCRVANDPNGREPNDLSPTAREIRNRDLLEAVSGP